MTRDASTTTPPSCCPLDQVPLPLVVRQGMRPGTAAGIVQTPF